MPRTSSHMRAALVLFSAGLVVTTCLVGAWVWLDLGKAIETRTRTREALIHWQKIYSNLRDAETGARGYILTADEAYLKPYNEASDRLPRLLMDAPSMEARLEQGLPTAGIEEIQKGVHELLAATQEVITVTRREGGTRAAGVLKQGDAKQRMDHLRGLLNRHLAELDGRLRALDATVQATLSLGGRALAALVVAALVASAAAGGLFRQALMQARRNERLALEKRQSDSANLEKSVFLATMSHEIRTPMNAVLGFGELLLDDARDEKQRRYAGSIVRSGQSLLQLINDILDFSRIEAGMVEIATGPVDVRELADFADQLFAHQCSEKGVRLRTEVEDWIPDSLMLDAPRLRQIVINLVGNAVKFTPSGGMVQLRFRGRPPVEGGDRCQLLLEVSDSGVGIPAARIGQIFDPFVQAKAHRDAELKGTGLGLAIVKRLTRLMGGTIEVRSEEGKGATFTVELPDVEISARLPTSLAPATEAAVDLNALRPSILLVVDDNPENLAVVQGYFEGTHHRVATAGNGRLALEWLAEHPRPDVVLMDVRMPVLDGRATLAELRKNREFSLLPVIALTASNLSHEERSLRETFDGYVRKPFTRARLFAELAQFIPPASVVEPESAGEPDGPAPASWRPLVERLRGMEQTIWPSVRDGMVRGEVVEFGSTLRELGARAECPPLESLATRLVAAAESFSPGSMELELNAFPALVSELEKRCGAPPP